MTIRKARPGDGLGIETARVLGWQSAYRGIVPDAHLDAMSPELGGPRWDEGLTAGHETTVFVATSGEEIDGFVSVGPARGDDLAGLGFGEVWAIYCRPRAWGTGVGQALLERGLRELPVVPVVLWALAANSRALRFYARNGFVPDGAEQDYAVGGATVPEVRLRLER